MNNNNNGNYWSCQVSPKFNLYYGVGDTRHVIKIAHDWFRPTRCLYPIVTHETWRVSPKFILYYKVGDTRHVIKIAHDWFRSTRCLYLIVAHEAWPMGRVRGCSLWHCWLQIAAPSDEWYHADPITAGTLWLNTPHNNRAHGGAYGGGCDRGSS